MNHAIMKTNDAAGYVVGVDKGKVKDRETMSDLFESYASDASATV
jgi:hypothetical protein